MDVNHHMFVKCQILEVKSLLSDKGSIMVQMVAYSDILSSAPQISVLKVISCPIVSKFGI